MRRSRQLSTDKFPPTVGEIVDTAKRLCQESDPERYRTNVGGLRAPQWYYAMKRIPARRRELAAVN